MTAYEPVVCWSSVTHCIHGSRKFCQKGSNSDIFLKRAIIGWPKKHHLTGVLLAGRWWPNIKCWLGSFVIFQGIRTSIVKKPYIFVIFQGGPDPLSPPLDPPMRWIAKRTCEYIFYQVFYLIFSEVGRIYPANFSIFRISKDYSPQHDIRKNLFFKNFDNVIPRKPV